MQALREYVLLEELNENYLKYDKRELILIIVLLELNWAKIIFTICQITACGVLRSCSFGITQSIVTNDYKSKYVFVEIAEK